MFECVIEQERGVHDFANPIYAGCAAGGVLGVSGGPSGVVTGCIGFAAFSAAIETFMGNH